MPQHEFVSFTCKPIQHTAPREKILRQSPNSYDVSCLAGFNRGIYANDRASRGIKNIHDDEGQTAHAQTHRGVICPFLLPQVAESD
eukprot:scaffold3043_cov180-Amphora_coffeaeformis.AAC.1